MAKITLFSRTDAEALREAKGQTFVTHDRGIFGGGAIQVTPEMLDEIETIIRDRKQEMTDTFPALVAAASPETRLAIVAWVFQNLIDHARQGGTFRYLVYDRLGFDKNAYLPLCEAGGLTISNEFRLPALPTEQDDLDRQILAALTADEDKKR